MPNELINDEGPIYQCGICKAQRVGRQLTTGEHDPWCHWYKPLSQAPVELGTKLDTDKPRMDLLDAYAMQQLAAVLTFGAAKKYAPNNWRKGIQSSRLLAAALRHIFAYLGGQKLDSESGLSHLAHAMCCLMFALNLAETKPELSDHSQDAKEQATSLANQEKSGG